MGRGVVAVLSALLWLSRSRGICALAGLYVGAEGPREALLNVLLGSWTVSSWATGTGRLIFVGSIFIEIAIPLACGRWTRAWAGGNSNVILT